MKFVRLMDKEKVNFILNHAVCGRCFNKIEIPIGNRVKIIDDEIFCVDVIPVCSFCLKVDPLIKIK